MPEFVKGQINIVHKGTTDYFPIDTSSNKIATPECKGDASDNTRPESLHTDGLWNTKKGAV